MLECIVKNNCFYFGKIGKPKGFKGEVNIIIDKDSPITPESLKEIIEARQ